MRPLESTEPRDRVNQRIVTPTPVGVLAAVRLDLDGNLAAGWQLQQVVVMMLAPQSANRTFAGEAQRQ